MFLGSFENVLNISEVTSDILKNKSMARHKRGQNRQQKNHNKNSPIHSLNDKNVADKNNFPDNYFASNGVSGHGGFSSYVSKQYYDDHYDVTQSNIFNHKQGRQRRQMNSNFSQPSSCSANKIDFDGSIYVNSNKSEFRPMAGNSSTINKPSSSIAELVMKGEIDHSLARVTTGRPTIVIYPTGKFVFYN